MDVTNLLSNFGSGASGYHDAAFLENQRQQEDRRFSTEQTQREAQTEEQQMQLSEQRRQFQAAAEDRAIATRYSHDSAPGYHPTVDEDGVLQPPNPSAARAATEASPSAPAADTNAPGNVLPAVTIGPPARPTHPQATAPSAVPRLTPSLP